jgi:uncharacterized protein (TIGR03437 family)
MTHFLEKAADCKAGLPGTRRAPANIMHVRPFVCLALLSASGAMAQSASALLGVDYSEWLPLAVVQMATDSSGAIYFLSPGYGGCPSCVTKLSADGTAILWQNQLELGAYTMAVDPGGDVFVIPMTQASDESYYVAKLNPSGKCIAWKVPIGSVASPPGSAGMPPILLAADTQGRAYAVTANDPATVVRVNAAGSGVDYTEAVTGTATSIAVDSSGAAFVAGHTIASTGFLARLASDGSAGYYTTLPQDSSPVAVAMDGSGNAVVVGGDVLQRVNSAGAVIATTSVPGGYSQTLNAAGNAYVAGGTDKLYRVRNSLAACGWSYPPGDGTGFAGWLTVAAPDGSILQTTYIPGAIGAPSSPVLLATGQNSTVLVGALANTSFAPTQPGPPPAPNNTFAQNFLMSLSPNGNAQTVSLACVGNAASLLAGPVAPGEVVTLFGSGLGPQQGVQPQATLQSPYPAQAAGVQVTFGGTPAPLLWVQDSQINAVAPWSLTPGQNTQICVTYNNVNTNCLTWPVVPADPAVFTVDGVYAVAENQDGTQNSAQHPAPVGSIVAVWATGLGPVTPPQADGTLTGLPLFSNVLPAGVEAVSATPNQPPCGCGIFPVYTPFVVTYVGPAPFKVAGISQINFQVVPYPNQFLNAGLAEGAIFVTLPSTQSQGFQIYVAGQ